MPADRTEAFPPPVPPGEPTAASRVDSEGDATLLGPDVGTPVAGPWPTVDGYEILGEIGRGGMGVVYKARQIGLNRLVALKMILAGGHASASEVNRFRTEAETIGRLQHPNIVHINEVGYSEGRPYFSLEYVDGGSLAHKLDGTPWPPAHAAQLVETLARAIEAAHQAGIVHRDLKPANILLSFGRDAESSERSARTAHALRSEDSASRPNVMPKITDFGLAKQMDSHVGQTQSGAILGTPSYMAPEQAGGKSKEIGPATDVYALGAIFYELLTGRPPFKAETPLDTVLQVVAEDPVPPRRLQPKLPRDLETICLKCLEKPPAKRYGSAADLAEDLSRWRQLQPIRARRIGRVGRTVRWCRRNPVLAAVVALAAGVIVTLSVVYYLSLVHENERTHDALRRAEAEQEQSQDALARSLFEQARALRLSNQAGRRWQALGLLQEAQNLLARERHGDPLLAEGKAAELPSLAELRREAAATLLLEDARVARQVSLAAAPLYRTEISPDGRHAMAWWMRPREFPPKIGIRLFDLSDGHILGEALLPVFASTTLSLSPDGKRIAFLIGDGKAVQLRDFPKGGVNTILSRPPEPAGLEPLVKPIANNIYFSPDGNTLINLRSEAHRADLYLWDLRNPSASRHLKRVEAGLFDVGFRSDGKLLAFRSGPRKIDLADLTGDGKITEIELPLNVAGGEPGRAIRSTTVLWSPVEPLLAIASVDATGKGAILLWDSDAGQERSRWEGDFDPDNILLAFSPDGKRLACSGADGTLRCYHVADRREILRIEDAHHDGVSCLRWENADHLLSAGMLNTFRAWECSNASLRSSVPVDADQVGLLVYSLDGRWLAFREQGKQPRVVVVEASSAKVRYRFDLPGSDSVGRLLFRPDRNLLAWVTPEGDAVAWELADGHEAARHKGDGAHDDPWFAPALSSDGRLVTPVANKGLLVLRDILTGEETPLSADFAVSPLAELGIRRLLLCGGHRLVGLPSDSDLLRQPIPVWNAKSGEPEGELTPAEDEVSGLIAAASSPDGRRLLKVCIPASFDASVGSSEPVLSIWNLDTRERLWHVRRNVLPSTWAFSHDAKLVAIGYRNGFVELWDVEKGEELFRWQPRGSQEVKHLAFSPDGARLASSDGKAPIHVLKLVGLRKELAGMGLDW